MNFQFISDLHFEMGNCSTLDHFKTNERIVIVAGDINYYDSVVKTLSTLFPEKYSDDSPGPEVIIFVAGNHEYYNSYSRDMNINECNEYIQDEVDYFNSLNEKQKMVFLNNSSVVLDEVHFIGGTLWTDMNLNNNLTIDSEIVQMSLNDYRLIKGVNSLRFSASESIERFNETKDSIIEHINESESIKKVINSSPAFSFMY